MFKKYKVKVLSAEQGMRGKVSYTVDFYVHSRSTRNGFRHEACVIGPLPFKREIVNVPKEDRRAKVNYLNRTCESWDGQSALSRLWEKLERNPEIDMTRFPKKNPFKSDKEPKHESLWTPEELFNG